MDRKIHILFIYHLLSYDLYRISMINIRDLAACVLFLHRACKVNYFSFLTNELPFQKIMCRKESNSLFVYNCCLILAWNLSFLAP